MQKWVIARRWSWFCMHIAPNVYTEPINVSQNLLNFDVIFTESDPILDSFLPWKVHTHPLWKFTRNITLHQIIRNEWPKMYLSEMSALLWSHFYEICSLSNSVHSISMIYKRCRRRNLQSIRILWTQSILRNRRVLPIKNIKFALGGHGSTNKNLHIQISFLQQSIIEKNTYPSSAYTKTDHPRILSALDHR